jgi:hypothetical protein
MRQRVAQLLPAVLVGGCSLIYNPNNIDKPPIDSGETSIDVDIRADANPLALELTEAFPLTVYEGAGLANSGNRPALVVLRGRQFVAANNLTVTVTPMTAATVAGFEVAGNGDYIALQLSVPISTTCTAPTTVPLHIEVSQGDGVGGTVMKSLDTVSVACLPELTTAVAATGSLAPLYSKIEIAGAYDFGTGDTEKATLRSTSFITISGAIDASAAAANRGPGGGGGGAATAPGGGLRPGGGGAGIGGFGGGGGGFVMNGSAGGGNQGGGGGGMTGDVWIATYATNASSGGGGGGTGAAGTGGVGGGGGGTLELTAAGNVMVGAITANGASGTAGTGLTPGGDGGSGTGGVVLVRAGGMVMVPSVAVSKGAVVGNGGASSDGRARIDAATGAIPAGVTKGPMWIDPPTKVTVQQPMLMLRGTQNDSTATLRVFDKNDAVVPGGPYPVEFSNTDPGVATVMPTLKAGFNKVCVWVAGGSPSIDESVNCVHIAFLPP